MKKAQLLKLVKSLPEDAEVYVSIDEEGNMYHDKFELDRFMPKRYAFYPMYRGIDPIDFLEEE